MPHISGSMQLLCVPAPLECVFSDAAADAWAVQEAFANLSAALTGLPKSQEHKDAIAASQRRRITASHILKAVESVHSQQQEASPVSSSGYPFPAFQALPS